MSYQKRVERQRPANQIVELRRKLRRAKGTLTAIQFAKFKTADELALEAIRASAKV